MGKIYRNGEAYTADANTFSVELTWAEYQALNETDKMNGTFYYITDVDPFVDKAAYGYTPIGTIISIMGNHAPMHYLACDGSTYNILDYPELANYFKNEFGTSNHFGGDGTTTFAVPDLQGEFLRGAGTNSHTDQGSGGDVGEHQDSTEVPRIAGSGTTNLGIGFKNEAAGALNIYNSDSTTLNRTTWRLFGGSAQTMSSSPVSFTIRPTNTSVLYCIATKNIYLTPENIYSTDECVVGQWIDGKPLYQKVIEFSSAIAIEADTWKAINSINTSNVAVLINAFGVNKTAKHTFMFNDIQASDNIIYIKNGEPCNLEILTLRYTKTTD